MKTLDPIYQTQLRRKEPELVVWAIGDPNTPSKGTLDAGGITVVRRIWLCPGNQ
jgi:hypothetical protein